MFCYPSYLSCRMFFFSCFSLVSLVIPSFVLKEGKQWMPEKVISSCHEKARSRSNTGIKKKFLWVDRFLASVLFLFSFCRFLPSLYLCMEDKVSLTLVEEAGKEAVLMLLSWICLLFLCLSHSLLSIRFAFVLRSSSEDWKGERRGRQSERKRGVLGVLPLHFSVLSSLSRFLFLPMSSVLPSLHSVVESSSIGSLWRE